MSKKYVSGLSAFDELEGVDRRYLAEADAFIGMTAEEAPPERRTLRERFAFVSTGWFAAAVSAFVALGAVALIVRAGRDVPTTGKPDPTPNTRLPSVASGLTDREGNELDSQLYETVASLENEDNDPAAEAETIDERIAKKQAAREANAEKIARQREEVESRREAYYAKYAGDPNAPIHTCEWIGNGGRCTVCGRLDMTDPSSLPANHRTTDEEAALCAVVTQYLTDLNMTFDRVEYSDLGMVIILDWPGYNGMGGFLLNVLPYRIYAVMSSDKLPIECPDYYVMFETETGHLRAHGGADGLPFVVTNHSRNEYDPYYLAVEPPLCTLTDEELLAEASRFFRMDGFTVRSATLRDAQWLDIDIVITEDTVVRSSTMFNQIEILRRAMGNCFQCVSARVYLPGAGEDDYGAEFTRDFVNNSSGSGGQIADNFIYD